MLFNADEIFEMAERVEANAAEYYTKAADIHAKSGDVQFLRTLAREECDHQRIFEQMRSRLADAHRQLPDDYPYLKATYLLESMASAHVGEGLLSNAQPLTAQDSLATLVERSLRLEEKSILFYLSLKDLVPDNRGKDQLDAIMREEQSHLDVLARKLAELTAAH